MTTTDFDPSHPHAICGTNALGARMGVGCGEPVFFDRPFPDDQHIAIRCADCMAIFCPLCARKHFDSSKRNFIELAMRHQKLKMALDAVANNGKEGVSEGGCLWCWEETTNAPQGTGYAPYREGAPKHLPECPIGCALKSE